MRKLTEKKLVLATHNRGKVRELAALLAPYHIEIVSAGSLGIDEPEETGTTFLENADIKSHYSALKSGLPAISDDSGLVVPTLGGAPGIYSARWAGEKKDFKIAMKKVEDELIKKTGTSKNHDAHFVCALSVCWPDEDIVNFEGKVFGKLTFPPRGDKGFGYDPIFIPQGHNITFGEMEPNKKHEISHRAEAFRLLIKNVF